VAEETNMTYIEVEDCFLRTNGADIPVARFDVNFVLDEIPSADLTVAVGRDLEGETECSISALEEGADAEIVLAVGGEAHTLLKGYILSMSGSDNAGLFKRTTSLVVHIAHGARKLAGSPPSSYAYTGDNQHLSIVQENLLAIAQFGTKIPGDRDDWNSYSGFSNAFNKEGDPLDAAQLLQFITEKITEEFAPQANDFAKDLLKPADGTTVSKFVLEPTNFVGSVSRKYRESWVTSNAWESLKRASNYVFMNLVPYSEGIYIAPTLALGRTTAVDISPDDYIAWVPGVRETTAEPVDGVVASVPIVRGGGEAFKIAFPPLDDGGAGQVKQNRFYHFRQLPDWVYPIAAFLYGKKSGRVNKRNKAAVEKQNPKIEGENLAAHFKTVGEAIVKVIYSQMKMSTKVGRVTFPFRTDLMPGTNVKFQSSDADAVEFIGDELTGMVSRTHFAGDMTQGQGSLTMNLDISTLRNKQDNENDEVTFAEHPVYDKLWKGTKLDGTLF